MSIALLAGCGSPLPPDLARAEQPPVVILPASLLDCPDSVELGDALTTADALEKYLAARSAERTCRDRLRAIRDLYLEQTAKK